MKNATLPLAWPIRSEENKYARVGHFSRISRTDVAPTLKQNEGMTSQRTPPAHTCFLRRYAALQQILGDVEFLAERRSFSPAATRFREFRLALEEHLNDEEQVLLPLYAECGGDNAPLVVSRVHANRAALLNGVEQVRVAILHSDPVAFCTAMNALDDALESHRLDEEQVVHPRLDHLLKNDADWEALCQRARRPTETMERSLLTHDQASH